MLFGPVLVYVCCTLWNDIYVTQNYIYIYKIILQTLLMFLYFLRHLQGALILRLLQLCNSSKIIEIT
jgi:hypothetical protein